MELTKMTAKEVLSIIRACKKSGVKDFKLGDLSFNFGDVEPEVTVKSNWKKETKQPLKEEQLEFEEVAENEEALLLDNPELYEQNLFEEGK